MILQSKLWSALSVGKRQNNRHALNTGIWLASNAALVARSVFHVGRGPTG